MMYGLSLFDDGSIELFDIKNSMVDGIIEDENLYSRHSIVFEDSRSVSIHDIKVKTTYFYDRSDRKEKVMEMLG